MDVNSQLTPLKLKSSFSVDLKKWMNAPLRFLGDAIDSKKEVKCLGVVFDENMTWDEQAKRVRSKAYLALNRIKRISSLLTDETKKLLTNALVMPHINYY